MARRTGARRQPPPPDDYGPPERTWQRRRSGGNQGLWIALGAAGLVGIAFLFVVMGGESSEEVREEARAELERFLVLCIDNNVVQGAKMVVPPDVLREFLGRDMVKNWGSLPENRKQEFREQAFQMLRQKVIPQIGPRGVVETTDGLDIPGKEEIGPMLDDAEYVDTTGGDVIAVHWFRLGHQWRATLDRTSGEWRLSGLDRLE